MNDNWKFSGLPYTSPDVEALQARYDALTIQAAKGLDKEEQDKKGKYIRQERYAGACSRSFYVGEDVEPEEVSAKFEDGILTISVPKAAKKQLPKQTSINIRHWPWSAEALRSHPASAPLPGSGTPPWTPGSPTAER